LREIGGGNRVPGRSMTVKTAHFDVFDSAAPPIFIKMRAPTGRHPGQTAQALPERSSPAL